MPPTIRPTAKPISPEQLQQELSKSAPRKEAPPPTPPEEQRPSVPDNEKQHVPSTPNLLDALNKSMKEKSEKAPPAKGDELPAEPPAKKEEAKAPPPKKEVISSDDAPPKPPGEIVLTEEEKGVLPHDSARVRARITYLNNEAKRVAAERDAVKKELEEAKKAPPSAASAEEVAKLREEHQRLQDEALRLRRRHDWENDAETKAKYREPVVNAEKTIEETLKRSGFAEPTLAAIKEAGGFAAFSRSRTTYPVEVVDPETQEKSTVNLTAAELARNWLAKIPVADAQLINQQVGRQEDLKVQEADARKKAEDDYKSYFENQTKAQREAAEAAAAANKKLGEEYENWAKTTEAETDWLKDAEAPADADEGAKKAIAERNAFAAELRASLKEHPKTPQEYGALKFNAAKAKYLERTMSAKDAEIERLTAELKKKSAAQKTTPRSGSLLRADPKAEVEKPKPGDTDVMSAINRMMQKKLAGDDE